MLSGMQTKKHVLVFPMQCFLSSVWLCPCSSSHSILIAPTCPHFLTSPRGGLVSVCHMCHTMCHTMFANNASLTMVPCFMCFESRNFIETNLTFGVCTHHLVTLADHFCQHSWRQNFTNLVIWQHNVIPNMFNHTVLSFSLETSIILHTP